MGTLGIIVIMTIVVMVIRLGVLSKYNDQNNDLLRNIKKFDINRNNKKNG